MNIYIELLIAALLPVIFTILLDVINKKTSFSKLPYVVKQIVYGIVFGGIAVLGTEYGVPFNGSQVNCRDAAVLTAGLVYGAPAGIIAGLIGGIERYFAVYWGIGTYTRIACSVSTMFAGFYSAFLRKFMFDDHKPSIGLSFAIGMVMEVFHMTMVFLTNMSDSQHAMEIVQTCSVIMIPANSISIMLATGISKLINKEVKHKSSQLSISQTIQRWLLVSVAIVFILTTAFTYRLQTSIADKQVSNQLMISIYDLTADIETVSNNNLLLITKNVADVVDSYSDMNKLCVDYGVVEINVVNKDGIIVRSNIDGFNGFDMKVGKQSSEFMCLLNDKDEFVQDFGPISADGDVYRKYAGVKKDDGFVQVGYNEIQLRSSIANQVKISANNKHVGESGYIIISDKGLKIVSSPEDHRYSTLDKYGFDSNSKANIVNRGIIDGEDCFYIYTSVEGYYIVSILSVNEAYSTRNTAIFVNTFMEILVFAVLFGLIYFLIKLVVVDRIDDVNKSLNKITNGDLNEIINVNTNHEFVILSKDINQTVDKLKEYIAEANARIDAEIQYAKNIQENALPHVFPNDQKYELFALMDAAKGVGGDFYDFYKTSRHGVNFMIADVSGKGIPGAMFMMRAKSELHALTETGIPVNDVFTYGNERLCEGNDAGMFVTAWEGNINLDTGEVHYANAGHNPPVLMRADGTCEYVRGKAGFVLAGMEGVKYKAQELQLNEGDILFLYTDGVVEATNTNKELYGEDRLIDCLRGIDRDVSMEYLCCEVIGDVGRFVGDAEQFDDITMMALKYKGCHGEKEKSTIGAYTLSGKLEETDN